MRAQPLLVLLVGLLLSGCLEGQPESVPAPETQRLPNLEPRGDTGALINESLALVRDATLLERLANATGTYYSIGASTFEPTIGSTSTGGLFMTSYDGLGSGTLIRRSMDRGQTWDDATPVLPTGYKAVPNSNDPYLYVDPWTDRVYDFDMCIILSGFCVSYSDDDGKTWTTQSVATGEAPALDHQSLAAAKPREGTTVTGYENVLVFCVNRGNSTVGAWCSSSFDGGIVWTPLVPGYPVGSRQCSGLHGHVVGSPDGRFYRGNPSCAGPAVYRSDDGGRTWSEHTITSARARGHEIAAATDDAGNVYALWIDRADGLPYLAWSTDAAETWSKPLMVGARGVTAAGFPTLAGGAPGRVAWAYIGTDIENGYKGKNESMEWTGYVGISIDVLTNATIANVPVNARDDPLDSGRPCGAMRCGGFGDFIDITIDAEGRPWAALAHNEHRAGIVGTLATGPSLRLDGDLTPMPLVGPAAWN